MIKRFAAAVVALVLVSVTLQAPAQDDPTAVVRDTAERVLHSLRSERARYQDDKALFQLVREVVFPRIDRERTAQWVLGANWRTATPAQREQSARDTLNPMRGPGPAGADRVTVRTEIIRPDGPKVSVDYQLTNRSGEWKVYDVIIENVSMVVTYRSEYAAIIKRDGMDGLLKQLSERNRSLNS
jgi:phospholipid transport system substrate-binding protein